MIRNTTMQFTRLAKLSAALMLMIVLGFGQEALAQSGEAPGDKEESQVSKDEGLRKIKIVKIENGKKTVEERTLAPGEPGVFMFEGGDGEEMDVDVQFFSDGEKGDAAEMIRQAMEKVKELTGEDVEMDIRVLPSGADCQKMIWMSDDEDIEGTEGEVRKEMRIVKVDDGADGEVKSHTIRIVNGDTLQNEITDGHPDCAQWKQLKGKDGKCGVFMFKTDGEELSGKELDMDIDVKVELDGEGDAQVFVYKMRTVKIENLDEEETAKFAPADKELDLKKLDFYPNPNQGKFTLSFKPRHKDIPAVVRVLDLQGKEIYKEEVSGQTSYERDINISDVPKGVYLLSIEQGEERTVKKVVVD